MVKQKMASDGAPTTAVAKAGMGTGTGSGTDGVLTERGTGIGAIAVGVATGVGVAIGAAAAATGIMIEGTVTATAAGEMTTGATIDATTAATRGAIGEATRVPGATLGCDIAAVRVSALATGGAMKGRRNRRCRRKSPLLTSPPSRQPWLACRVCRSAVLLQVRCPARFLASSLGC